MHCSEESFLQFRRKYILRKFPNEHNSGAEYQIKSNKDGHENKRKWKTIK